MREAKIGRCQKCNEYFYIHEHHILPKSIFGKGKTIALCPNCHIHCHEYMKKNIKNPQSENETLRVWNRWFKKVAVSVTVITAVVAIYFLLIPN